MRRKYQMNPLSLSIQLGKRPSCLLRTFLVLLMSVSWFNAKWSCEELIDNFPFFTCKSTAKVLNQHTNNYFLVESLEGQATLRVLDNSPSLDSEESILEHLKPIHGVVQIKESKVIGDLRLQIINEVSELDLRESLLADPQFFKSESKLIIFFSELLRTVSEVHKSGYVVRDLLPAKIFIDQFGHPVILDFSRAIKINQWEPIQNITANYRTPGEIRDYELSHLHKYTGWEDFFAVGVMIYKTIYHHLPVPLLFPTFNTTMEFQIVFDNTVSFDLYLLMAELLQPFSENVDLLSLGNIEQSMKFHHLGRAFDAPIRYSFQERVSDYQKLETQNIIQMHYMSEHLSTAEQNSHDLKIDPTPKDSQLPLGKNAYFGRKGLFDRNQGNIQTFNQKLREDYWSHQKNTSNGAYPFEYGDTQQQFHSAHFSQMQPDHEQEVFGNRNIPMKDNRHNSIPNSYLNSEERLDLDEANPQTMLYMLIVSTIVFNLVACCMLFRACRKDYLPVLKSESVVYSDHQPVPSQTN